jgi:methylmalonyl-CoA mutase
MATYDDWKALVEKELAGAAFDRLVTTTAEGLALQPLYTQTAIDPGVPGAAPFVRGGSARAPGFQVCMRAAGRDAIADDLAGGADALWIAAGDGEALAIARARGVPLVIDGDPGDALDDEGAEHWLGLDPLAAIMLGWGASSPDAGAASAGPTSAGPTSAGPTSAGSTSAGPTSAGPTSAGPASAGSPAGGAFAAELAGLAERAAAARTRRCVRISSLAVHAAGADAADELAIALSTTVAYLRALDDAGVSRGRAASKLWFQIAVGRDTFGELCKLRALRVLAHKVFAAAGEPRVPVDAIHAVCSMRTVSQRDPWVNLLRVTTQVFAAALGGAQRITPLPYDAALAGASAQGRRVARNTALVLREESHLGRVLDAAGGSYYIEERTDALAREAWARFTAIERDGGVARLLASGALRERLAASWAKRAAAIARRKEPVLGVSEFANPDEQLPAAIPDVAAPPPAPALIPHRDAEAFEALRTRVERAGAPRARAEEGVAADAIEARAAAPEVVLVTLGPPAEHRGRVGFAQALFATAGLRTREVADGPVTADIACLCGSDERYAAEAVARAAELRGVRHLVLAGRPGALEAELRAAGVGHFIFVGSDVLATLSQLVGAP